MNKFSLTSVRTCCTFLLASFTLTACTGGGDAGSDYTVPDYTYDPPPVYDLPPIKTLYCRSGSGEGIGGVQMEPIGGYFTYSELSQSPNTSANVRFGDIKVSYSNPNHTANSSTGTLKLKMWAVSQSYAGGGISGYIVGQKTVSFSNTLNYLFNFQSADVTNITLSGSTPPRGEYCIVVALTQQVDGSDAIVDYTAFSESVLFW